MKLISPRIVCLGSGLIALLVILYFGLRSSGIPSPIQAQTVPIAGSASGSKTQVKAPKFAMERDVIRLLPKDQIAAVLEYQHSFAIGDFSIPDPKRKYRTVVAENTPLTAFPYLAWANRASTHLQEVGLLWLEKDPGNLAPLLLLFRAYSGLGMAKEALDVLQEIKDSKKFDLYLSQRFDTAKTVLSNANSGEDALSLLSANVNNNNFHKEVTARFCQDLYQLFKQSQASSNTDVSFEIASVMATVRSQISQSDPQSFLPNTIIDDTELLMLQGLDQDADYGSNGKTVAGRVSEINDNKQAREAENMAVAQAIAKLTPQEKIQWQDLLVHQGRVEAYKQLLGKD